MYASIAALHLLLATPWAAPSGPFSAVLAQADAPAQPGNAPATDAAPPPPDAPATDAAPPPPDAPAPETPPAGTQPPPVEPPATPPPATPPAPPPSPAPRAAPARRAFPSLFGAESLGGASAATAWAGWPSLGAAWAMGVTAEDDVGAFGDYDWAKSELRLGGLWRRPFATAAGFDVAFRLNLALYVNLGSTYVYSDNHSERGFEVAPALVVSQRAAGGLFAASAEGPLTVTTKYRTGLLFSPRVAVSYEAPIYPGLTMGARIGAGYRAGAGDAPLRTARGELQFLVIAGYQLL